MKKLAFIFVIAILFCLTTFGQVRVTSEGFFQIGYNPSNTPSLTFGINGSTGNPRGSWAIEHWDGGLNFWRPWPMTNSGSYKLFIKDNGYIGINYSDPSYHLVVNGDILTYGQLRTLSDERFKTDIKPIISSLDNIIKLAGVSYKMKKYRANKPDISLDDIKDPVKRKTLEYQMALSDDSIPEADRFGIIAQELMKVFPELVDMDKDGFYNVDYIGLIPVIIEAIKDQQTKIKELTAQIEDCCAKNSSLKSASIETGTTDNLTGNKAQLDQNIPNPFSEETKIGCYIPEESTYSVLYIYNMNGTQLQQFSITGKGNQSVSINGNSLVPGMYLYALVIDGREVDTKRMILTK